MHMTKKHSLKAEVRSYALPTPTGLPFLQMRFKHHQSTVMKPVRGAKGRSRWFLIQPYLKLLRNRSFAIYWTGSTIVQLGLQFSTIALTWFVLQTTGSPTR